MVQELVVPVLHQIPSREAGVLMAILGKMVCVSCALVTGSAVLPLLLHITGLFLAG